MTLIKRLLKNLFDTWAFDSYLTVRQNRVREKYKKFKAYNINDVRYIARKLAWRGGFRIRSCQEIKFFWRTLSCLNILSLRDETLMQETQYILSFAFLLFLWDASQKLKIPSHFPKCKPLIHTLFEFRYLTPCGKGRGM